MSTNVLELYLNSKSLSGAYIHLKGLTGEALKATVQNLDETSHKSLQRAAARYAITHRGKGRIHTKPISSEVSQAEHRAKRRYSDLLDVDNPDPQEWSELEWCVREEYLREIALIEAHGGCSGCAKASIRRKYYRKLSELV